VRNTPLAACLLFLPADICRYIVTRRYRRFSPESVISLLHTNTKTNMFDTNLIKTSRLVESLRRRASLIYTYILIIRFLWFLQFASCFSNVALISLYYTSGVQIRKTVNKDNELYYSDLTASA
jgi:hypothetical protein